MTTKKVRLALTMVEEKVDNFYRYRTRESLEKAVEEIQEFNHSIGILLWDEMDQLSKTWHSKEDKHVK